MLQNKRKIFFAKIFLPIFLGIVFSACFAYTASAASLSISPAISNVSVGNIISVKVVVGTNGDAINSSDGTIQFPTDMLEVMSINKSSSIFSLWVEDPSFDNSQGTISFDGGLPTPGYVGNNGQVLSIVFRAKKSGTASIVFSDSAVRKNDGLGTDVLSSTNPGTVQIASNADAQVAPPPVADGAPDAPVITSSTNPQSGKWYNNPNVALQWVVPSDVTAVETLIGSNPSSIPTVVYSPAINSKILPKLDDGVWYFHARFKNANGWGDVASYKIQIDTVAPNPFKIVFPKGDVSDNPRPTVDFSATDALSGIDHYEVKIDDGQFVNVSSADVSNSDPYTLTLQDPGTHNLLVKAVDLAGNETVQTAQFTVTPINTPQIQNYQSELSNGDLLKVSGQSYPLTSVEVDVQDAYGHTTSQIADTLDNGAFSLVWSKSLDVGSYTFTVRAIDKRGAKSMFTTPVSISVKGSSLLNTSSFILGWLSLIIIIILALGGIVLLVLYFIKRAVKTKKSIDQKLRGAESSVHKAFDLLRDNVREQIKTLEKAQAKRELTKEEEKVIKRLQENLTKSEQYLEKEIKDIENIISK